MEEVLVGEYRLSKAQVDGLWTYVGNKGQKGATKRRRDSGEFWRCTLIESETRLRAARGIAKSETEAAVEAFKQLKSRGHRHSPPPMVSDGWGGYDEAMVEVWGKVPEYKGRGTSSDQEAAQSAVAVPTDGQATRKWAGNRDEGEDHLRRSAGSAFALGSEHELYVERTNLTSRHMNGRLVRKTFWATQRS